MRVPAYDVRVRETNDVSRIFITEGDGIGLRTNNVPTYDTEAWVRTVYGEPPEWLTAEELTVWYKERYRDRVELCMTLMTLSCRLTQTMSLSPKSTMSPPHQCSIFISTRQIQYP